MRQPLHVIYINTIESLLKHIDFIAEGWKELRKPYGAGLCITFEDYMKVLFRVASGPREGGCIILYTSKNDKPLGYVVVFDDTETGGPRSCIIYAGYSNGRYVGASEEAIEVVNKWAKQFGYKEIHAQSRRIGGASSRIFRRKLGMRALCIVYSKEVC